MRFKKVCVKMEISTVKYIHFIVLFIHKAFGNSLTDSSWSSGLYNLSLKTWLGLQNLNPKWPNDRSWRWVLAISFTHSEATDLKMQPMFESCPVISCGGWWELDRDNQKASITGSHFGGWLPPLVSASLVKCFETGYSLVFTIPSKCESTS